MTPPVLEDCAKKGVHSVVIVSGGGKELGGERAVYSSKARLSKNTKSELLVLTVLECLMLLIVLIVSFQGQERMVRSKLGPVAFFSQVELWELVC